MGADKEAASYRCVIASSLTARLRGLLGRKACAAGEVLVLAPCKSVHTFAMSEDIHVSFVGADGRVLASHRNVRPRRLLSCKGAAMVLERRARFGADWLSTGDEIALAAHCLTKNDAREQGKLQQAQRPRLTRREK
ncbi:MAG: DUF192 domain-containing protein [Coriobacteriales bacterium]|jgi:uncharacterized membrane protein (UPF0127 family)|nr:DUF192 domain-containing protein [Coriobacteriales bacterium]